MTRTAAILAAILLTAGAANAQAKLGDLDKDFLTKAAQGNYGEMAYVPTVLKRSASADVKAFGRMMITDHGKANRMLKTLAAKKGVKLPMNTTDEEKHVIARLGQFNGAAFDRQYRAEMVRDHIEDIADYKREISLGSDPDVRAFARKTLPTLQRHLQMARQGKKRGMNGMGRM